MNVHGEGKSEPVPQHWEQQKHVPEIMWTRGLVPSDLTATPEYSWGELSEELEGVWSQPIPFPTSDLVFGTDASGGPRSKDPRARVISDSKTAIANLHVSDMGGSF